MFSKKRNEPDGLLSAAPNPNVYAASSRLMQHPEAESASSLDSEPFCSAQRNFDAPYANTGYSASADRKYGVAVGKRSCTHSWQTIDVEERSKRSRVEYSDATVSGVTFQMDLNSHHARKPDAEFDSASVRRHVGSCHDSGCWNLKRVRLGEVRSNEMDLDEYEIRCNESDADIHATYVCSRAQESRGNMLSVARQGISKTALSSISCCGDGSYRNSRSTSFLSVSSQTSVTHLGKAEAGNRLVSSKHVSRSPQIRLNESPFLSAEAMHTKSPPPSYVLSSGRLSLEEEARLGRRLPTIDDDFEKYFSSLML